MENPVVALADIPHLSLDDLEMVLLVDHKPGSKLDLRLTEIERKLDHILAILGAANHHPRRKKARQS